MSLLYLKLHNTINFYYTFLPKLRNVRCRYWIHNKHLGKSLFRALKTIIPPKQFNSKNTHTYPWLESTPSNIAVILILRIAHFVFLMIITIFSYNNLLDRFSTLKIRDLLRPGLELRDKCKLQTIERLSHKYCYFSALVLEKILKKIYQVKLSLPVVVY